jgi:ubiquinone/menaquinone biosynthesis C-methylase UbiE
MTLSLDRQNAYRDRYRMQRPGWRPATEIYEALIRDSMRPGMRVLDLGCGRGGVLEQLGEDVTAPLGLDPDWQSLHEHRLPALPRAVALADALPLRDNCLDLVLCSWVFEHLSDPPRVLAEIKRVLRPGGRLIFLTPNAQSLIALINRGLHPLQHTLVPKLYGRADADTFPLAYRANTPARIRTLAAHIGLSCETLRRIEDPTYLAFSPLLFRVSAIAAQVTPPVHLVGVLVKV